jgi:chitodextrinase
MNKNNRLRVALTGLILGLSSAFAQATAVSVSLGWNATTTNTDGSAITDLAGYRIFSSTVSFFRSAAWISTGTATADPGVTRTDVAGSTTGTTISLNSGATYFLRLTAYNTGGNQSAFNVDNSSADVQLSTFIANPVVDTSSPTVPAGLHAVVISSTQINLSWTASTDNVGVTGYKIFRGGAQFSTTTATSFSNTGLTPSTTYTYTVAAYDAARNTSAQSTSTSAVTNPPPFSDVSAPTVPGGFGATAVSATSITLGWTAATDNVGVTGYKIFRGGTQFSTTTATSFVNSGLTLLTSYTYGVAAYDAVGNTSAQASTTVVTSAAPDVSSPTVPAGLATVVVSSTQINLSWNASTDNVAVTGYRVYRGGVSIATTAGLTYQNTNLTPATLYSYQVAAYDAMGNTSAKSVAASTTTNAAAGGDVTAPTVSLTAPANASLVTGTLSITGSAADNVGVTRVDLSIDGVVVATDFTAPYNFSVNTLTVANGNHLLTLTAYDAAANSATSSVTVFYNNPHVKVQCVRSPKADFTVADQGQLTVVVDRAFEPTFTSAGSLTATINMPSGSKSMLLTKSGTNASVYSAAFAGGYFSANDYNTIDGLALNVGVGTFTYAAVGQGNTIEPVVGGTVFDAGGTAQVIVPQGDLTAEAQLTINTLPPDAGERAAAAKRQNLVILDAGRDITLTGGSLTGNGAMLLLPFDPALVAASTGATISQVRIAYFNVGTGQWEIVTNAVLSGGTAVYAHVTHFSPYATVLSLYTAPGLVDAYAYPNPAVGSQNPVIRVAMGTLDRLEVTIYDVTGSVVHSGKLDGSTPQVLGNNGLMYSDYTWQGKKASGTYFAVVHGKASDGTLVKARIKLAVVK